jgi:protein SCO1
MTNNHPVTITLVVVLALFGLLIINPRGGSTSPLSTQSHQQSSAPKTDQSALQNYFTDVVLTNQNGEKMRLYSDLLKGRVVVIHSFFSTCQGSCLPLIRNMRSVQTALGDKVGSEVYLISISVDPTMDTPERLKKFARDNGAKPGWLFLSGDKTNVEFALKKLGQFVDQKENHLNIFIIGNERTGLWKKAFGLAKSDELIKVVESVLNDKGGL